MAEQGIPLLNLNINNQGVIVEKHVQPRHHDPILRKHVGGTTAPARADVCANCTRNYRSIYYGAICVLALLSTAFLFAITFGFDKGSSSDEPRLISLLPPPSVPSAAPSAPSALPSSPPPSPPRSPPWSPHWSPPPPSPPWLPPLSPLPPLPPSVSNPTCFRGPEYCVGNVSDNRYCVPHSEEFTCPIAVHANFCDERLDGFTDDDKLRILGWNASNKNTTEPDFASRALRRSSLDPNELITAYDEVWTDGVCLEDLWMYRPYIDLIYTLLGGQELFRFYLLERGGPEKNYARAKCDLQSYTNTADNNDHAYWQQVIQGAQAGDYQQIIDVQGSFCTSNVTTYRWTHESGLASGQCQLYDGVSYTIHNSQYMAVSVAGRYITTVDAFPDDDAQHKWAKASSMFNAVHEMMHIKQNAHAGKRLYMENGGDGECCTLILEHVAYITYNDYIEQQPERFTNLRLMPAWKMWTISTYAMDQIRSTGLMPEHTFIDFPDGWTEDSSEPKWFTAALLQRVFRLYVAYNVTEGFFRNHALNEFKCALNSTCHQTTDRPGIYDNLNSLAKQLYPPTDEFSPNPDDPVMDKTYALKGVATLYFIHHSKNASGLGFEGFYNYELAKKRETMTMNLGEPSEIEMFALAGFESRTSMLNSLHDWIIRKLLEGDILAAAEEISDTLIEARNNINIMKDRNVIRESGNSVCTNSDLPIVESWYDPLQDDRSNHISSRQRQEPTYISDMRASYFQRLKHHDGFHA